MKKGQKKRIWTKEQKLEIIEKHLKEHISVRTIEKEYNVDRSLVCHWIRDYNELGEKALEPKGHKVVFTPHQASIKPTRIIPTSNVPCQEWELPLTIR